jgi:phosphoglucosamine mutase
LSSDLSKARLFGTDGVRGRFGEPPLDHATVNALAVHLAATLKERANGRPPQVVLGGDTRESTPEICRWLAAGLNSGGSGGIEVRYAGVIPTPGVAYLTREMGAAAGVVVSASHNPYPDNGIKLLDPQGTKWSDEDELALENLVKAHPAGAVPDLPAGRPEVEPELRERYLSHLAATLPGDRPLAGLKVVLDAGNGAASTYAEELFERLGARVTLLHAAPDGRNVNEECGSTAPGEMASISGRPACAGAAGSIRRGSWRPR